MSDFIIKNNKRPKVARAKTRTGIGSDPGTSFLGFHTETTGDDYEASFAEITQLKIEQEGMTTIIITKSSHALVLGMPDDTKYEFSCSFTAPAGMSLDIGLYLLTISYNTSPTTEVFPISFVSDFDIDISAF